MGHAEYMGVAHTPIQAITLCNSTVSKKKKHTQTVNNTQPPSWVRKRCTLTWSLSATSIPESPPPLVTWSTSAVELTSVPSRSSRRKPPSWARVHSSMRGFLTCKRPSVSVVSPSISLSGSSRPQSTTSPSLMPLVTVISSRTLLLVPPRLIALFSSLLPVLVSSRLVSPRMARPVSTLFSPTLSVSSSSSLPSTRSTTPPTAHGTRVGRRRLRLASPPARPFSRPLMPSTHLPAQLTSPSVFLSRMFTRLVVLARCQSVVSRPVSSRPVWSSPSPQLVSPLKSSPSRCTTSSLSRVSQETTLASTSRTFPSRKSVVVTSPVTPRTTHLRELSPSTPRLSSLTTLVKSVLVTLQSLIATLPTLLASSVSSWRRSIVVPVNPLRTPPGSSSRVMLPSSRWFHPSPCVLRPSLITHLLDVSPFATRDRLLLSVSSSPSSSLTRPERLPRLLSRLVPRSKLPNLLTICFPGRDVSRYSRLGDGMGCYGLDSYFLRRMAMDF